MRHFSLYEFAFNPRVELVLRTDDVMCQNFNARLTSLDDMDAVDPEETEKLKAFLTIGAHESQDMSVAPTEDEIRRGGSSYTNREQQESIQGEPQMDESHDADIDYTRVGKLYSAETPL